MWADFYNFCIYVGYFVLLPSVYIGNPAITYTVVCGWLTVNNMTEEALPMQTCDWPKA